MGGRAGSSNLPRLSRAEGHLVEYRPTKVVSTTFPLTNRWLWIATVLLSIGAAYIVARAEGRATGSKGPSTKRPPESRPAPLRPANEVPTNSWARPSVNDLSELGADSEDKDVLKIPMDWMKHFRPSARRIETHKILGLTYQEGQRMVKAAEECLAAAAKEQIAEIDDFVMSEGETKKIPALSDGSMRALIGEVVAVLPDGSRAFHADFLGFLMERELRREHGQDLEVTLEYTGGISTFDTSPRT